MRRLTPYLFFLLAILAFGMIALSPDDSWQSDEIDPLRAVLIVAGVFLGAHAMRWAVGKVWQGRRDDGE